MFEEKLNKPEKIINLSEAKLSTITEENNEEENSNDSKVEENIDDNDENISLTSNVDFSEITRIRINNSFTGASKALKVEFIDLYKNEISKLKGVHDDLYSLLLDTDVGVVSPTNAVITTESDASAEILNNSIDKISSELDIKQVLIFISSNNWKKETEKFVQNKGKVEYKYIDEPKIEKTSEIVDMAENIFDTDKLIVEE